MPLPDDPAVVQTSTELVNTLQTISGPQPGYRPAHARGILLDGVFKPTEQAASLSDAWHFQGRNKKTIVARFSSSTGDPQIADNNPSGNPRGFAIRFVERWEPRRVHTDIIAHSVDGFPGTTGQEVLEFFNAARDGTMEDYLSTHPKAQAFVAMRKPTPVSFARENYFGINAFRFIKSRPNRRETIIRYRLVPEARGRHYTRAQARGKEPNFLHDELLERLENGPIVFRLMAQIAEEGDVTNDNTVKWPEDRELVELGTIRLEAPSAAQKAEQKYMIFDPIPRTQGIEPTDDPLLDVRAGVYLISGRQRREAPL
ncbi:catalase related protein [Hypoxylon cercidicola]|nr:catalase related protein [Hypoxylon cercidicola]